MDDLQKNIRKYLKGELSPSQRHELEMMALHDPFLAEALEGAESIDPNTFVADIDLLNHTISVNKKEGYIWPLRIAASIVIIISVTFLIIKISPRTNTEQLALQKTEAAEESPATILSDTVREEESIVAKDLEEEEKSTAKPTTAKPSEIIQPKEENVPVIQESKEEVAQTESFQTQLEMADDLSKDLTQTNQQKLDITKNLAEQNSELVKARSQERKTSSPSPSSLSGAGAERKKTAQPDFIVDDVYSSVAEYQQYLSSNVVYPKEAIDNQIEGEVIVSFLVEVNGELSDFRIDKGLGFGCDEELIRLIKEGPKWKTSPERKKVSFLFQLEK